MTVTVIVNVLKFSSTGRYLWEENEDQRCVSWKVSFNMTVELEKNVPKDVQKYCADYNREPQTIQDKCTSDENCVYSTVTDKCIKKDTKK